MVRFEVLCKTHLAWLFALEFNFKQWPGLSFVQSPGLLQN